MADIRHALMELKREMSMREQVYPSLIVRGKLTETQAQKRNDALRKAIEIVEERLKVVEKNQLKLGL
jgi:hypothetical protein